MKTLIYTFIDEFTTELAIGIIPKGFEPIELSSEKEVLAYLDSGAEAALLVTESAHEDFLRKVREKNNKIHLYLLAHASLKPADLIRLSSMGITALIPYSDNHHSLAEEILHNAMSSSIMNTEKRFHVRVQPSQNEKIEASVFIKGLNRFVHGDLIDLSAGGAAIRLKDSIEASILDIEKVYNPLMLHITGTQIKTLARLKGKREDIAGFQFENIEKHDMHSVATYIHSSLQQNSKKFINTLLRER